MKATAKIQGNDKYPDLKGWVSFCQTNKGVIVTAEVCNLPKGNEVFGFHIHEGTQCTGNSEDAFSDAKSHYNPDKMPHPEHSGDLPPLFSNNGYACMTVLTNRFKVCEIIGRVIIIHSSSDDFKSQPGGNAGEKIACGVIKMLK